MRNHSGNAVSLISFTCNKKAGYIRQNAREQCEERNPVETVAVPVSPAMTIKFISDQFFFPDKEIISDHDTADGAE